MIRTVSTHTTGIEAHIVRCRLEYEGIPAFVAFEHHVWAMWSHSVALGGVRVQVPHAFFENAAQVVNNINTGKYESELKTDELEPATCSCPSCNSKTLSVINWPRKIALVVVFLFSVPIPYTRHLTKCNNCAHTWVATEQRPYPLYVMFCVLILYFALVLCGYEMWCHWCKLHCENPYVCMP